MHQDAFAILVVTNAVAAADGADDDFVATSADDFVDTAGAVDVGCDDDTVAADAGAAFDDDDDVAAVGGDGGCCYGCDYGCDCGVVDAADYGEDADVEGVVADCGGSDSVVTASVVVVAAASVGFAVEIFVAAHLQDLYNVASGAHDDILDHEDRIRRNNSYIGHVLCACVDNLVRADRNLARTRGILSSWYLGQCVKMYTLYWCRH